MAGKELEPKTVGEKDCTDPVITGRPSMQYDYVHKVHNEDTDFGDDLELKPDCEPWYYYNMRVGRIFAEGSGSTIHAAGEVISNGGAHVLSMKKNLPFDMPHPNKKGWRLRHVCIEGPEIAVYCRGKVPP
jgi:hypothetical protein